MEFEAKKNSSYLDFMKTRGNRYRLALLVSLGVISQYSGNALFSNYMNLIYNSMGITDQNQKIPVRTSEEFSGVLALTSCSAQRWTNPIVSDCQCFLRLLR